MFSLTKRKSVILYVGLLVTVSVLVLYILQRNAVANGQPYVINWTLKDTISCHYVTEGDSLPSAEDIAPQEDSIFFQETSCRGGLNSRQACAVEAVARKHPNRNIYVLFNSPISDIVLSRSCLSKLRQLRNVKLARVHTALYAKGTALGDMLAHKENNRSLFKIEHTSDMLRYVTMYKYGGVYLDTDMLVVKSLDDLGKNWVAREDEGFVNVAAMAIDKKGLGHKLVANVLESIKSDYRPDLWVHNGPGAMNRVLLEFCNTSSIAALSANICHGFQIYDPKLIYPIHYTEKEKYFKPGVLSQSVSEAYTHHLWNRLTHEMPVVAGSPYDQLARKHCPTIRRMFGDRFGS